MRQNYAKFLFSLVLCFVVSFAVLPNVVKAEQAAKTEPILLLNLQYISDTDAAKEIQFYGNQISPNVISINDRFS